MYSRNKTINFPYLFKKHRLKSEIESLSKFGNLLAEEGMVYESSIFSRWQGGSRIPCNREVIINILIVFIKHGGINTLNEANGFLESANQGFLTNNELRAIFKIKKLY